jgi:hypothetical protein
MRLAQEKPIIRVNPGHHNVRIRASESRVTADFAALEKEAGDV